jgi:3-oxoacyl-[acyl-carrier protein] reductase
MNLNLTGRHALVCGSSQGIGLAAAIELSRLGANVTLFARNAARLSEARAQLSQSAGQKHNQLVADFADLDQVSQVLGGWLTSHPGAHVLVNNTGGPPPGLAINAEPHEFIAAFQNHLLVNQTITKMLVPFMRQEKFGRIINVISTSVKQPIAGLGVSNTIRGAVANWAKTLASELASDGITVNNVLPGATRTGRLDSILKTSAEKKGIALDAAEQHMLKEIPAGRFGTPEEIGAAVAFLASPAAAYITGINLPVDGGRTQCL